MNTYFIGSLIAVSTLFLSTTCEQNPTNLVQNPGFEIGKGEEPEGWIKNLTPNIQSYRMGVDTSDFHSGKASYKISRIWTSRYGALSDEYEPVSFFYDEWTDQQAGIRVKTPIPIDPHKKFLLSFWYKTEEIHEHPSPLVALFGIDSESTPDYIAGSKGEAVNYAKTASNSEEWKQYFVLLDNIPPDGEDLELALYQWFRTQGSIWIDDIKFKEANEKDVEMFEQWRRQSVPSAVGKAGTKDFTATGFYRVEKDDDRWWLIDPEGNPTWSIGIVGRARIPSDNPAIQTEGFKEEYGTNAKEARQTMYDLFIDLGFNAFAGWTDDEFAEITEERYNSGRPYLPMTEILNLKSAADDNPNVYAQDRYGHRLDGGGHQMVDPFNPEWRKAAREKAERIIPEYKDKPWFMGWFVDNEIIYDDLFRYVWAEYSSKVFIKRLEEKYKDIESLNQAWTSPFGEYNYQSFNDILVDKPEPLDWDDPLWSDFVTMERYMMKEYINYTYNLVKELDPNHLIISNRLHVLSRPHLYRTIDLWGKYDIVCMNIYPDNNKIGFNPGELELMRKLHEGTGRPIIIGEWSIPALDSGMYEFGPDPYNRSLDWSFPQVLRTQKKRAEAYKVALRQLVSLDFMVGAGWYETSDKFSERRRANRGIWNSSYKLYHELTDTMKKVHEEVKEDMKLK